MKHSFNNPAENPPFFIVGCPRSGTTLLCSLVDAHPELCVPPESHIFTRFSMFIKYYGDFSDDKNLYRFVHDFLSDSWIKHWRLSISAQQFIDDLIERSFAGCIDHLFEIYAMQFGKKRWGDKSPSHTGYVLEIKQLFPNAKFIHLIRDGRDVAESLVRVPFSPIDIVSNAQLWRKRVSFFHRAKKYLSQDDYLELSYESLVRNHRQELSRVFNFLNVAPISYENTVPDSSRKMSIALGPHRKTIHDMLNEPISDKKVGIYKEVFNQRKIAIFETIAGDMLTTYGYPLETSADAVITKREKILFRLMEMSRLVIKYATQGKSLRNELQWRLRSLRYAKKMVDRHNHEPKEKKQS